MKKRLRKKGSSNEIKSYPSPRTEMDDVSNYLSFLIDPTSSKTCYHTAVSYRIRGALAYVTCTHCDDSIVVNSSSLAHLDLTGLGLKQRWKDFPHMDSQVCRLPNLVPDHDSEKCEVCSTAAFSPDTPSTTDVTYENAAPKAVKMSKSAKKKRRKKNSHCQIKTVDSTEDTASIASEPSQPGT